MPRIASLASLTSATTFVTPVAVTGLLAKDSLGYGTAGAISTTTNFNSQTAIDIYWRRTSTSEAAISVTGYTSNVASSITRYNVDNTTTTLTGSNAFLDLAIVPHSGSHVYKIVEVSEQTLSGTGSFLRQSTEFPNATFNATNNGSQFLAVGQTMGYRETLNTSVAFQREYVVDFFIDNLLKYRFNLECHYIP